MVVDAAGRVVSSSYARRVAMHEAGHFLVAYLLGLLPRGYTLTAADAFARCVPGFCASACVALCVGAHLLVCCFSSCCCVLLCCSSLFVCFSGSRQYTILVPHMHVTTSPKLLHTHTGREPSTCKPGRSFVTVTFSGNLPPEPSAAAAWACTPVLHWRALPLSTCDLGRQRVDWAMCGNLMHSCRLCRCGLCWSLYTYHGNEWLQIGCSFSMKQPDFVFLFRR